MATSAAPESDAADAYRKAEYDGLVRHLIDRATNRRQLVTITLAAVGVVGGYSLQKDGELDSLVVIPFVLFFGFLLVWHETQEIVPIQKYIRDHIESQTNGVMQWETRLHRTVHGYRVQPATFTGLVYILLCGLVTYRLRYDSHSALLATTPSGVWVSVLGTLLTIAAVGFAYWRSLTNRIVQ